jgi:FkbM family methyltransferase
MTTRLSNFAVFLLARNRKTLPVRFVSRLATKIINGFENYSYDSRLNGEENVLRRLAPAKLANFFDVGANRGSWSLLSSRYFPGSALHCFEIAPATYARLSQSLRDLKPKPVLNNFGLLNRSGTVTLNFCDEDDGLSTILPGSIDGRPRTPITVKVETGDAYARMHSVRQIDFLKLDVEGAENLVLEGFSEMLKQGGIRIIQFEYGGGNVYTHFLLKDFYDLLEPLGYVIGKIFPDGVDFRPYVLTHENFIGPNFLAVRKDERELLQCLSA